MPGRGDWGETHSNSMLTDWQARRLNIKYADSEGAAKFVHTLNNTVIASPRILIAILENYQRADGSVVVPEILRGIRRKRPDSKIKNAAYESRAARARRSLMMLRLWITAPTRIIVAM